MMIDHYFSGIDGIVGVIVVQWLMEFPRQEYYTGLSFLTPGDLLDLVIELMSLKFPTLVGRFFLVKNPMFVSK